MSDYNSKLDKRSSTQGDLFFNDPLASVWQKTGKQIFNSAWGELAYESVGSTYVVAGDPLADTNEKRLNCLKHFMEKAHIEDKRVCGYYFSKELALASKLEAHQAGVSLIHQLNGWDLRGKESEEFRRALKKGQDSSLEVLEITSKNLPEWKSRLLHFSKKWRAKKGPIRIGFLLSPLSKSFEFLNNGEHLFICHQANKIQAVVSFQKGNEKIWYLDQLMQLPRGQRFALDFLITKTFLHLKSNGADLVNLGFCPGIIQKPSTWVEKILALWSRTRLFYSPKGLYNFKRKYSNIERDRYLLLDPMASRALQLFDMERVTLNWDSKI